VDAFLEMLKGLPNPNQSGENSSKGKEVNGKGGDKDKDKDKDKDSLRSNSTGDLNLGGENLSLSSSSASPLVQKKPTRTITVVKKRIIKQPKVKELKRKKRSWEVLPESPMENLRWQAVVGLQKAETAKNNFDQLCKPPNAPPPNHLAQARRFLENVDIMKSRIETIDNQVKKCVAMKIFPFTPIDVASQLTLLSHNLLNGMQLQEYENLVQEGPKKVYTKNIFWVISSFL